MKVCLQPPEPVEPLVVITLTQNEAKMIRQAFGGKSQRNDEAYYSNVPGFHKISEELYYAIGNVVS